jgi:hypothetical protein
MTSFTRTVQSTAYTVFGSPESGIVGFNPTLGMSVCQGSFYICVVFYQALQYADAT